MEGRERETLIGCLWHTPIWELACNPGACLDWESVEPVTFCFPGQHPTLSHTDQEFFCYFKWYFFEIYFVCFQCIEIHLISVY